MKQKYLISTNPETQKLSIKEYAELEKGEFAFVCEEIHEIADFRNAMEKGTNDLVSLVRRPNMYPRQEFGEKIAQGIIDLLNDESGATSNEVLIDDIDAFVSAEDDMDPRVVYEDDENDDADDEVDDDEVDMDLGEDLEQEDDEAE